MGEITHHENGSQSNTLLEIAIAKGHSFPSYQKQSIAKIIRKKSLWGKVCISKMNHLSIVASCVQLPHEFHYLEILSADKVPKKLAGLKSRVIQSRPMQ